MLKELEKCSLNHFRWITVYHNAGYVNFHQVFHVCYLWVCTWVCMCVCWVWSVESEWINNRGGTRRQLLSVGFWSGAGWGETGGGGECVYSQPGVCLPEQTSLHSYLKRLHAATVISHICILNCSVSGLGSCRTIQTIDFTLTDSTRLRWKETNNLLNKRRNLNENIQLFFPPKMTLESSLGALKVATQPCKGIKCKYRNVIN